MAKIYIGLGSNLGARAQNIRQALFALKHEGIVVHQVSKLIETPALLPDNAEDNWNRPYINAAACIECDRTPEQLLVLCKRIEYESGRSPQSPRWSPRTIDIDILYWQGISMNAEALTIPHIGLTQRPFVVIPLLDIAPELVIEGKTVFEWSQHLHVIPQWMAIVNATPDSFSDGGAWQQNEESTAKLDSLINSGVQIIDIGGSSTRPSATPVTAEDEWGRVSPLLEATVAQRKISPYQPNISIDTFHPEVADKALAMGADWINDVTGLRNPEMLEVIAQHKATAVAMHSLTVPADPAQKWPDNTDPVQVIADWLNESEQYWLKAGLKPSQIVLDPGIGFGKSALHSLALLSHCKQLRALGYRLLMGHSRKSFMNGFSEHQFAERDAETLGVSMSLWQQGTDYIRVHNTELHQRAYRAWSHIE